jgi:trimeric autotransporter adhesin
MASTFSNLGLNLQATGENSGTWGAITNVNLQDIDAAIAGVFTITLTGSTTLAFTTNSSSTTYTDESGRNKTIILNGSLSATTVTVTVPNIEKDYVIINNSGGTATISSGGSTTVSIGTGSKNYVIVDPSTTSVISAVPAANPGGSNTFVQYNNSNSFGGSSTFTFDGTTATIVNLAMSSTANLLTQSELRFQDTSGGQYVGLRASTTVSSSFTLNLPTATGTANQVIQTDGSGNLSFATISGGAAWQAIKTSNFNVTAKEGYFIDTTSTTITATLPASPAIGDFVQFIDYAGTFDTNNFTVARNGNKIQGDATDLTVSVERAGLTLVYTGSSTQGWLLETK